MEIGNSPQTIDTQVREMFENLFRPTHLLLILLIALLIFGPKKLPEIGKGLGDAIRAFRNGMVGDKSKTDNQAEEGKNAPPKA